LQSCHFVNNVIIVQGICQIVFKHLNWHNW